MIKAIESNLYRIEKAENFDGAVRITIKETDEHLVIYISELEELFELIEKSREVLKF